MYYFVEVCGMSIHQAARETGVGASNAKKIMKRRRREATIDPSIKNVNARKILNSALKG